MGEEELYMLVSTSNYRLGKSGILKCQADLLNSLKKVHNLKILARQKQDLKKSLSKLLNSTLSDINSLQERLPRPKIPETVKKIIKEEKKELKIEGKPTKKKNSSFNDSIEEELRLIKEKLKMLNN